MALDYWSILETAKFILDGTMIVARLLEAVRSFVYDILTRFIYQQVCIYLSIKEISTIFFALMTEINLKFAIHKITIQNLKVVNIQE
jgi:uncharacterized membrane protein